MQPSEPLSRKHFTHSAEETFSLGQLFGKSLSIGTTICFFGDLGAGKTTFIKGVLSVIALIDPETINSPTFQYLHTYSTATMPIHHFDLYRLRSSEDFLAMGFDEYWGNQTITCIEWAERIQDILPLGAWIVDIKHCGKNERLISIQLWGS